MRKSIRNRHEEAEMNQRKTEEVNVPEVEKTREIEILSAAQNGGRNANAKWFECSGYCADNFKRD